MATESVALPQASADSPEHFNHNFETFFNTIDDLLFVLDDQGRILYANDTVIKRLDIRGMNWPGSRS